jgi:uncharacterized membrane protein YhaH (DUF805 family)
MNFDFERIYLTTEGRIGRAQFWLGVLGIALVAIVCSLIVALIFGPLSFTAEIIVFIMELIIAYPAYCVLAKRFQDRGRPGILGAVGIGVPVLIALLALLGVTGTEEAPNLLGQILSFVDLVIGLWILIDLGVLRGTAGPNEYGPDPVATM